MELVEGEDLSQRIARGAISLPTGLLAGLLRRLGEHDDADALLSTLKSPSGRLIYHMVCSDSDAGADSFAAAIAQGEVQPAMWFGAADFLRPLHSSPRWPALVKMLNLPPETVRH
jgi:hypothetical protein